jgi:hypothetical protein
MRPGRERISINTHEVMGIAFELILGLVLAMRTRSHLAMEQTIVTYDQIKPSSKEARPSRLMP